MVRCKYHYFLATYLIVERLVVTFSNFTPNEIITMESAKDCLLNGEARKKEKC